MRELFVLQEIDAQLDHLREQEQMAALLVDRQRAHLEAARVTAGQRSDEIVAALALLEAQRAALVSPLPAELIALYQAARRRWPMRPWVVLRAGDSCTACGFHLRANPAVCPGCGRLLVSDAHG